MELNINLKHGDVHGVEDALGVSEEIVDRFNAALEIAYTDTTLTANSYILERAIKEFNPATAEEAFCLGVLSMRWIEIGIISMEMKIKGTLESLFSNL